MNPVKTLDSILTVAGSRRRFFLVLIASFIVGFMEIGSVGSLVAIVNVCSGSLISHPLGCESSLLLGGTIIVIITVLRVGFSVFYKHYCVEISKSIDLLLFKRIQLNYRLGEESPISRTLELLGGKSRLFLLNILIPSVRLFMAVGGIVSIIVALVVVQNSEVFYVFAFIGFYYILAMAVIRYFQRGASEELANKYRKLGAVGTEPSRFLLESKFYKIEKFFIERFLVVLSSIRRIELRHEIFSEIPRFVLEGLILCFPLVAFGFLNATDGGFDVATALPGLVVLVFGGLRGLPAAQAIYYTVLSFQNQNQNMVSILVTLTEE